MTLRIEEAGLKQVFHALLDRYGPQSWWPGNGDLEVMIGAVLTQNTAWSNVERALANMGSAGTLSLKRLIEMPQDELARLIKPSGYFNVKARRLINLCQFVDEQGGLEALHEKDTAELRAGLLRVNGIGPETADDILLYALDRPVFVVDAYTRRVFRRLGLASGGETYEALRLAVQGALGADAALFNELHALIVVHGKEVCRSKPRCQDCCLAGQCRVRDGGLDPERHRQHKTQKGLL